MRELLDTLKQLIISLLPRKPLFAEVLSYDEATNTITVKPTTDSDNIIGVSLDTQGDKDKGFWAIPKVGSDVLVGFIDNEPYVEMYYPLVAGPLGKVLSFVGLPTRSEEDNKDWIRSLLNQL